MAEGDLFGLRGARKVYLRTITNTEKEILDLTRDFVDPHNEIIYRDNKIMFTIVKLDCNLIKIPTTIPLSAQSVSTAEPSPSDIKVRLWKLEIKKFNGNILE